MTKKQQMDIDNKSAKTILNEFTEEMDELYQWFISIRKKYANAVFNEPEFAGYNPEYAEKFIRTYDIIHSKLTASQRNLLYLFTATGQSYKLTVELLNGEVKNMATLRVMIHNIRKIIKENI